MKHYPPEFKAEAVASYRSPRRRRPQITDDLVLNQEDAALVDPEG